MAEQKLAHLYYGDGAGKSTAAAGLALRALGRGKKVLFCQFLKDGGSGEIIPLSAVGADVRCCGSEKFVWQLDAAGQSKLAARLGDFWSYIARDCPNFDLVVLDEALDAAQLGFISLESLHALILRRDAELVVTGHTLPDGFAELFDYVTEFRKVRHPFDSGTKAREGVEF